MHHRLFHPGAWKGVLRSSPVGFSEVQAHWDWRRKPVGSSVLLSAFGSAQYNDTPGTTLRSANGARTISAVGEPLSPSGVAYILQPSAYPARWSGTGNRSSPFTLI